MHCFQDEFGNWHSYTFGQESSGTASIVVPNVTTHFRQPPLATSSTSRFVFTQNFIFDNNHFMQKFDVTQNLIIFMKNFNGLQYWKKI